MKLSPLFGSALLMGLLATGTMAAEAISGANVRSGPGTSYSVVASLAAGESVTVTECAANGWCMISHPGPDGWVSAKLLADNGDDADFFNGSGGGVQMVDDRYDRQPDVQVQFGFGFGNGMFGYNDRYNDRYMGGYGRNRGDLVCLVTFFHREDVAAGRDADVQRAEVLPRRVAQRLDRPNDRRAIFDYGSNRQTIRTCRYLDRLN